MNKQWDYTQAQRELADKKAEYFAECMCGLYDEDCKGECPMQKYCYKGHNGWKYWYKQFESLQPFKKEAKDEDF